MDNANRKWSHLSNLGAIGWNVSIIICLNLLYGISSFLNICILIINLQCMPPQVGFFVGLSIWQERYIVCLGRKLPFTFCCKFSARFWNEMLGNLKIQDVLSAVTVANCDRCQFGWQSLLHYLFNKFIIMVKKQSKSNCTY